MAEASVQMQSEGDRHFFCHKCNASISHVLEDYTCPTCKSGFIEEVPGRMRESAMPSSENAQEPGPPSIGYISQILSRLAEPQSMDPSPLQILSGYGRPVGNTPAQQSSSQPTTPTDNRSLPLSSGNVTFHNSRRGRVNPSGISLVIDATGGPHNFDDDQFGQFFRNFISNLLGNQRGNIPGLTNLGDYVWGQQGLDAIVTQLMNQMEGSGPPPMATEQVEQLPTMKVTQDQIDKKMQCSVCWDDFSLGEDVKRLECEHIYHPNCIVPWLNLHGTCPVCRKDFTKGKNDQGGNDVTQPSENRDSGNTSRLPSQANSSHSMDGSSNSGNSTPHLPTSFDPLDTEFD